MKEKFENFWYYNKRIVLFALFFAFVIITSTVQCVRTPKSDLSVLCVYTGYNDFSAFESKAAETVGDINGDGKAIVTCENLYLTGEPGSPNDTIAMQKIPISFAAGENRLYIMDKEFFESETYGDGFEDLKTLLPAEALEDGAVYDGKTVAVPAENCPYLKDTGIKCDNLFVGIPCETEALKKQKNAEASSEASKRLICELVKP
ncbi:MAG: hypothetical protein J5590_06985 [Clostridia bacterium]|nr:hypothetical protein [Clostridia bacterium]